MGLRGRRSTPKWGVEGDELFVQSRGRRTYHGTDQEAARKALVKAQTTRKTKAKAKAAKAKAKLKTRARGRR
jgi:hypothetical protein